VLLAGLAAACTDGRPPTSTDLGKIVSVQNDFADAAAQLQRFAETRLNNRTALRREFMDAGFERSVFVDEGVECERFDFKTNAIFPSTYFVNICGKKVFANAGQQAP